MKTHRFTDKRVLATGGIAGIGPATSRPFSDEGARVAVLDIDQDTVNQFVKDENRDDALIGLA